ncbi:MAG: small acid-soluble spore protein Tlp [Limnochordia bacterium]|jgi:small acid-soluble spore protein (thioredoxin-like protein)|nr:small acid-soluble spore protein Tlp [Bacillota bacterium]HOB08604.1 small acid-soluble spore protein Tlp [Limnochordia bacterium]NLH30731.1 small acid-soluble spore protein Tlp [Bacillota bacterium]HPT92752.1 small acid-soluble spore protein Tlp [Limnochordia bacterium]HPZ30745.1 small acid-soluble spore protein Tlp [Limnochordia bacterium]
MPKPKPDDRSDNVDKLQEQVVNTIENLEEAHQTLQNEDLPEEQRQAILAKNRRREQAIAGKREEIKDEYRYQQSLQQNKDE